MLLAHAHGPMPLNTQYISIRGEEGAAAFVKLPRQSNRRPASPMWWEGVVVSDSAAPRGRAQNKKERAMPSEESGEGVGSRLIFVLCFACLDL